MSKTKDEKYIVYAYQMAMSKGDVFSPVDRYEVGTKLSMNPKGVDSTCRMLAQANFIKNLGEKDFILTNLGKKLVDSLLEL